MDPDPANSPALWSTVRVVWHLLVGLAIILIMIRAVIWAGRTKPSVGNGSNTDAARRYGQGNQP
jgi:hypothetical protein